MHAIFKSIDWGYIPTYTEIPLDFRENSIPYGEMLLAIVQNVHIFSFNFLYYFSEVLFG